MCVCVCVCSVGCVCARAHTHTRVCHTCVCVCEFSSCPFVQTDEVIRHSGHMLFAFNIEPMEPEGVLCQKGVAADILRQHTPAYVSIRC
jgi:hypothetical protein